MILDILTVLFFVLGFALILWMAAERRRDVLHGPYVTKPRRARSQWLWFGAALLAMAVIAMVATYPR
jgi:fumarate reductase subunit D